MTVEDFRAGRHRAQDAGWNSIPTDRDALSTEYVAALNELGEGEFSGVIRQDHDWVIVFCDEVYNVSKTRGHVDLSVMPSEILDRIRQDAHDALVEESFTRWMENRIDIANVEYMDIPDGLPYDVNVAIGASDGS